MLLNGYDSTTRVPRTWKRFCNQPSRVCAERQVDNGRGPSILDRVRIERNGGIGRYDSVPRSGKSSSYLGVLA